MNVVFILSIVSLFVAIWYPVLFETDKNMTGLIIIFLILAVFSSIFPDSKKLENKIQLNLEFYVSQTEDIDEIEKRVKDVLQTALSPESRKN